MTLFHIHDPSSPNKRPTSQPLSRPGSHILDRQNPTKLNQTLGIQTVTVPSSWSDFRDLRQFVEGLLHQWKRAYLIIDGFEKLRSSTQIEIKTGLHELRQLGLKVLLFSAAPEIDNLSRKDIFCDGCDPNNDDRLSIYWHCAACAYDLCDACKSNGKRCKDVDHVIEEPYDFINISLYPDSSELKHFVQTDLELEYGLEVNEEIVEAIYDSSDQNINLAKLRLDQVRDLGSLSDVLSVTDRLPSEIVAFFETEVYNISTEEPSQQLHTLMTFFFIQGKGAISMRSLEEALSLLGGFEPDYIGTRYPYVRQVLKSARGLLSTSIKCGEMKSNGDDIERYQVEFYTKYFELYVKDEYNPGLVSLRQQMDKALHQGFNPIDSCSFEIPARGRAYIHPETSIPFTDQSSPEGRCLQTLRQGKIEAVLEHHGTICKSCQTAIFSTKMNKGVREWSSQSWEPSCKICMYAYELMKTNELKESTFYWSRRTMGRTSDFDDNLVITLRQIKSTTPSSIRRFVFVLKSEIGFVPDADDLGKDTTLKHTGTQISKWIQTCEKEHLHCKSENDKPYTPTRLIDLKPDVSGRYHIIERSQKAEGRYVTLSHSWGKAPKFLRLTTENKERLMKKGFLPSELENKNFIEAIEVAHHLGVRYIWIDSLCICQEGEDEDFKEEGDFMHAVYQSSFCNIAAADSKDGHLESGLFRDRPDGFSTGADTNGPWAVLDQDLWSRELLQSYIYTRGWVFQGNEQKPGRDSVKPANTSCKNECLLRAFSILLEGKCFGIVAH